MYLLECFLFNLPELLALTVLLSWQRWRGAAALGREKEKCHILAFPLGSAEAPGQMSHHPLIDPSSTTSY